MSAVQTGFKPPFSELENQPEKLGSELEFTDANVGLPRSRKSGGGRPPKYDEPSRPITLTLPESTLEGLTRIDSDRGQAIVKLTERALRQSDPTRPSVEIMEVASNIGLLVVGPSVALRRISFLHMVELAPERYLLALDRGNDFRTLELAIHDALEEVPKDALREREMIIQLLEHIRNIRKSERVSMAEILFVRIEDKPKG